MKSLRHMSRTIMLICLGFLAALSAIAQDKKVDVNINTGGGDSFWGSPWVWIIGVAVFILLLVALMRGGRRA